MVKKDIEEMLQTDISDELFAEALGQAKHKQKHIFDREKRDVVMQDWYLMQLVKEQIAAISFSRFTMDLCEMLRNMEKSTQSLDTSAPTASIL